ncbi:hypothetical protein DSO57_1000597 [Entomophthora muscae]|uniref:Uncharacterized protein n=1 Tax=Entomophthora muscae TaxID=34485 RepID=A0ACC2S0D0_9FUNG|nr:hypothetical protein DSO57_1000597 [Entomophthora muscae]
MDLLRVYGSDSDSDAPTPSAPLPTKISSLYRVQPAPDVDLVEEKIYDVAIQPDETSARRVGGVPVGQVMKVNVPYEHLPVAKIEKVDATKNVQDLLIKHGVYGHLDQQAFSDHDFRTQENTFRAYGYAKDPSLTTLDNAGGLGAGVAGTGYVGDFERALLYDGATTANRLPKAIRDTLAPRPKRKPKGDVTILEGEGAYQGPWAGYEGEEVGEPCGPSIEETEEQEEVAAPQGEVVDEVQDEPATKKVKDTQEGMDSTIFHGDTETDYLGRTYMHVPQDLDIDLLAEPGNQQCFLPKKRIHTWTGHSKAVSAIRFFPNSGHLLLSAGMDNKLKIWDVYHDRKCLRTFMGHSKAVRDVNFNNKGTRFISASYDRYVKIWDTETGKCIRTFTTGKIPYCAKFHPDPDKQNIFLAGCSDKKIIQFDTRSGDITQEYDQHLGAVNSITFVDDNRRFVSTSDDKTMRVWEFGIPVVIKYVAEPYMHSMPAVSLHPSRKWMACQSLDNQILIYGAKGRFSLNSKKRFAGHVVAGYACQPNFSADGRFVMSGDADGNLWFWDWKTSKILKKLQCHTSVLIGCEWHPHETSKVATCSWDGTIKYWD